MNGQNFWINVQKFFGFRWPWVDLAWLKFQRLGIVWCCYKQCRERKAFTTWGRSLLQCKKMNMNCMGFDFSLQVWPHFKYLWMTCNSFLSLDVPTRAVVTNGRWRNRICKTKKCSRGVGVDRIFLIFCKFVLTFIDIRVLCWKSVLAIPMNFDSEIFSFITFIVY